MSFPFSFHALVDLNEGDERAIGAAVTVALCGHWEHDGPCRWPHTTSTEVAGSRVAISVNYECPEDERPQVESLIAGAISSGLLTHDGKVTRWRR